MTQVTRNTASYVQKPCAVYLAIGGSPMGTLFPKLYEDQISFLTGVWLHFQLLGSQDSCLSLVCSAC